MLILLTMVIFIRKCLFKDLDILEDTVRFLLYFIQFEVINLKQADFIKFLVHIIDLLPAETGVLI